MAITLTKKLERVEVYPPQGEDEAALIMIVEEQYFDDPEDDLLPVRTSKARRLKKTDEEGNIVDISGEDQFIQDLVSTIWTE
jgi:hypothetical protein